jgi:hypothetical protein
LFARFFSPSKETSILYYSENVREEVVLRPRSRYATLKVTNGTMTADKGVRKPDDWMRRRVSSGEDGTFGWKLG